MNHRRCPRRPSRSDHRSQPRNRAGNCPPAGPNGRASFDLRARPGEAGRGGVQPCAAQASKSWLAGGVRAKTRFPTLVRKTQQAAGPHRHSREQRRASAFSARSRNRGSGLGLRPEHKSEIGISDEPRRRSGNDSPENRPHHQHRFPCGKKHVRERRDLLRVEMGAPGPDRLHGGGSARAWHPRERHLSGLGEHRVFSATRQGRVENAAAGRRGARGGRAGDASAGKLHQRSADAADAKTVERETSVSPVISGVA